MSKAGFKNPEEYFNEKAPMNYHVIFYYFNMLIKYLFFYDKFRNANSMQS